MYLDSQILHWDSGNDLCCSMWICQVISYFDKIYFFGIAERYMLYKTLSDLCKKFFVFKCTELTS